MSRALHVACLQTRPQPDFATALDEAVALGETAVGDGAQFIALPEYCGGLCSDGAVLRPPSAPEDEHSFLAGIRAFARDKGIWALIGSIAVPGPGDKLYNRGFVVDNQGQIRSRYDKIHLFDIQLSEAEVYRESASVASGGEAVLVDIPSARLGHSICYDLRFPALYRDLAHAGAEILAVPAAFTKKTGEVHWHVLNRARAIENGAFVLAPCATGPVPGGGECYGHSLIIGPWGEVLADGGEGPGITSAVIELDEVAAARGRIPSLQHDRAFESASDVRKRVA